MPPSQARPSPQELLAAPLPELPVTSVLTSLRERARQSPAHSAIVAASRTIGYEELVCRSNGIAQRLREAGVGRGSIVAIGGTPSVGLFAAALGTLGAGAAVLFLDRALASTRRRIMLEEARPRLLVTVGPGDDRALEGIDGIARVHVPAELDDDAGGSQVPAEAADGDLDRPAYVFFTSGTTGRPKGVLGSHKGLAHFVGWQREQFGVGGDDRVAQVTGLSFDVVLREIFLPLTSGATLCIPDRPGDLLGASILPWLARARITILHTVPTLAQFWMPPGHGSVRLASLRCVFFAGEPLTAALVRQWRARFPGGGMLVNLYGPTETTLAKFWYRVPEHPPPGVQPVGRPLPATQAFLLRPDGSLCESDEAGEIAIRTRFRSLGYINAPDEQRARFVPNPCGNDPTDLLYRTGDLGGFDAAGELEVRGRTDHQLKINGVRVEPDEVSAVLREHPAVTNAAVAGQSHPSGGQYLAAYWVPVAEDLADIPGTVRSLRTFCQERLLPAMVPAVFVALDRLPITPNGKLDRAALPELSLPAHAILPGNDDELRLHALWSQVLDRSDFGVTDNFFQLGGNSLAALEMGLLAEDHLHRSVTLEEIFEHPTIRELAMTSRSGQHRPADPIPPAPPPAWRELSPPQRAYCAVHMLRGNQPWSTMVAGITVDHRVTAGLLGRCLTELICRHGILASRFEDRGRLVLQVLGDVRPVPIDEIQLAGLSPEAQQDARGQLDRAALGGAIDCGTWPLFRVTLADLGQRKFVHWAIHHWISDAASQEILKRDLSATLHARLAGREPGLPPLPVSYADYARWSRARELDAITERQGRYWRDLFRLPYETRRLRVRPDVVEIARGRSYQVAIGEASGRWRACARAEQTSLFAFMLSGYFVLFRHVFARSDVLIRSVANGRTHRDVQNVYGLFFNPTWIRQTVDPTMAFTTLLRNVQAGLLRALDNQEYMVDRLLADLQIPIAPDHYPLTTVAMNLLVAERADAPVIATPPRHGDLWADLRVDLMAIVRDRHEAVEVEFDYRQGIFSGKEIEALMAAYLGILDAVGHDPGTVVGEIDMDDLASIRGRVVSEVDYGRSP